MEKLWGKVDMQTHQLSSAFVYGFQLSRSVGGSRCTLGGLQTTVRVLLRRRLPQSPDQLPRHLQLLHEKSRPRHEHQPRPSWDQLAQRVVFSPVLLLQPQRTGAVLGRHFEIAQWRVCDVDRENVGLDEEPDWVGSDRIFWTMEMLSSWDNIYLGDLEIIRLF